MCEGWRLADERVNSLGRDRGGGGKTNLGSHANGRKADERTGTRVSRDTTGGQHRDEDDKVHDVRQGLKTSITVGDNEGGSVGARSTKQVLVVGAHANGDHQRTEHIKQTQTDPNGADGAGDRLARVGRLSRDETTCLGSGHGEHTGGHDIQEALEAIGEAVRLVPVLEANGPTLGGTARRDDNHANDDHKDPAKLDGGKDDFGFGKVIDGANVDEDDDDQENGDPSSCRDRFGSLPEAEDRD